MIFLVTLALFLLFRGRLVERNWIESPVAFGPFTETIAVGGEVDSREYVTVNAPRAPFERQLIDHVEEGKRVMKGEIIARFDPAPVFLHMQSVSNTIQRLTNDYIADQLDWDIKIYNASVELSNASERLHMYELSMETLKFESEYRKAVAEANHRQALLDVANTKRRIEQARYQKDYLGRRRLGYMKYWRELLDKDRGYLDQYEVKAALDSVAVFPLLTFGGMYRKAAIGDFLEYGREFMRLPAFSTTVVRCLLEERMVSRVRPGTPGRLILKGYPGAKLSAVIATVAGYAKEEQILKERRSFEVILTVDPGKDVALLKPGMTVDVDLRIKEFPPVYRVPKDFVVDAEGKRWVYVVTPLRPSRREIKPDGETDDYLLLKAESGRDLFSPLMPNRVAWIP